MTSLTLKDHQKQERNDIKNNYFHPTSLYFVSKIIEKENKQLIDIICDKYNFSQKEKDELYEKFLKVNYFTPNVVKYHSYEKHYNN